MPGVGEDEKLGKTAAVEINWKIDSQKSAALHTQFLYFRRSVSYTLSRRLYVQCSNEYRYLYHVRQ